MKTFRNYMENEGKKNIIIIGAAVFFIILSGNIFNSIESYRYRRLCDQYREQLIAAEEANRELANRLGRITEITGRLHETTERNVKSSRSIVELTEELRAEVYELESCIGSFNQSEYYNYWDSYFRNEELMN